MMMLKLTQSKLFSITATVLFKTSQFEGQERHFQGLRDTQSISGTVPDNQGQLTCMGNQNTVTTAEGNAEAL